MSRAESIKQRLEVGLAPAHLEVLNESHMHAVPKGAETHFRVIVASAEFEGKNRVARHRIVNALLKEELASGLHALTIAAFSPAEWSAEPHVESSPQCLGGSKKS